MSKFFKKYVFYFIALILFLGSVVVYWVTSKTGVVIICGVFVLLQGQFMLIKNLREKQDD